MKNDTPILPFRQSGTITDPLTELAREGARRMLSEALKAEADAFVASFSGDRLDDGRQRVVRHGKVSCPLAGITDSVKQELRDENLAGPCKYRSVDVYANEKLDDDFVSPMRKDVGAFPCRVKVQSTYTLHLKDLSHTLYTCNPPHIGMPENALRVVLHCQRTHEKKALSGCYRRAPVPKRQEQERVADISVPGGPLCHRTMSVQQTYEIQERRSRQ